MCRYERKIAAADTLTLSLGVDRWIWDFSMAAKQTVNETQFRMRKSVEL